MTRIMLVSNGSGFQIDACMPFDFFKASIALFLSDRDCPFIHVAQKHHINCTIVAQKNPEFSDELLELANLNDIDYIITPGCTKLLTGSLLVHYENRIFNCHPSILPAFKGYYSSRDRVRNFHPRKIFERTIEFNSRITGHTIHLLTDDVDAGKPMIVSSLPIPYHEDVKVTRHKLFIQECKSILQMVKWLVEQRYSHETGKILNATFDSFEFSPALDNHEIINLHLPFPG